MPLYGAPQRRGLTKFLSDRWSEARTRMNKFPEHATAYRCLGAASFACMLAHGQPFMLLTLASTPYGAPRSSHPLFCRVLPYDPLPSIPFMLFSLASTPHMAPHGPRTFLKCSLC